MVRLIRFRLIPIDDRRGRRFHTRHEFLCRSLVGNSRRYLHRRRQFVAYSDEPQSVMIRRSLHTTPTVSCPSYLAKTIQQNAHCGMFIRTPNPASDSPQSVWPRVQYFLHSCAATVGSRRVGLRAKNSATKEGVISTSPLGNSLSRSRYEQASVAEWQLERTHLGIDQYLERQSQST